MLADSMKIEAGSQADASPKGGSKQRLLRVADLDGRTKARKAADAMLQALADDMGCLDQVSAGTVVPSQGEATTLSSQPDDLDGPAS